MPNRVSVVIPVYNGERYLADAIASVLAQTHPPAEVIVVDDGSTDSSANAALSFGAQVTLLRQRKSGAGAARNHGVSHAQGDLLAFLDADDLWHKDKLARQVAALATQPEMGMVFSYIQQFISPDLDEGVKHTIYCPPEPGPGYLATTCLIRRHAFWEVGVFSHIAIAEFIDWYLRAQEKGVRDLMLPDVLAYRRLHGANQGLVNRAGRANYAQAIKAALNRRRLNVTSSSDRSAL